MNKVSPIFTGVRLEDSSFCYTKNGKRGATLIEDVQGFAFSHHVTNKIGQETWVCSRRKIKKCRAAIKILDGFITEQNVHNHEPLLHF